MVKGISRQVIVVHSQEPALFDQAIFILNDNAVANDGVTDAQLLQEAGRLMENQRKKTRRYIHELTWASVGAIVTALFFMLFILC